MTSWCRGANVYSRSVRTQSEMISQQQPQWPLSLAWPDRFFPFFFVVAEKGSGLVYRCISSVNQTRPFFPPPQRKTEKAVWPRETNGL